MKKNINNTEKEDREIRREEIQKEYHYKVEIFPMINYHFPNFNKLSEKEKHSVYILMDGKDYRDKERPKIKKNQKEKTELEERVIEQNEQIKDLRNRLNKILKEEDNPQRTKVMGFRNNEQGKALKK